MPIVLKVGAKTSIISLRTAILKYLEEDRQICLDAIGVVANYVAIKAIIGARGQLATEGEDVKITPLEIAMKIHGQEDEERNAVRWVLTKVPGTVV